jgi:hypothetical protein
MVRFKVAAVPVGLIDAEFTIIAAGTNVGTNVNVDPVRLKPVTWKFATVVPVSAAFGLTDVITGALVTVKFWLDVTVFAPTSTEIGPVVAPTGTVVTKVVAVADSTAADVPLKRTMLSVGFALKP